MTDFDKIISLINLINKNEKPAIIAIDGRCGSGKTTLAAKLSEVLDCTVSRGNSYTDKRASAGLSS